MVTDFTIFSYLIVLWCVSHCPMLSSFLVLSLKFTALTFQGLKDMPSAPGPLAYDKSSDDIFLCKELSSFTIWVCFSLPPAKCQKFDAFVAVVTVSL